nr:hypothetical protein GCM10025699_53880 [Microbacterium flavescens]
MSTANAFDPAGGDDTRHDDGTLDLTEVGVSAGNSAAEHLSPAFPERAAWGTASKLRAWQAEALEQYFATDPVDFLAAATPVPGRPPSPSAWPPSCCRAAPSTAWSWSHRPST